MFLEDLCRRWISRNIKELTYISYILMLTYESGRSDEWDGNMYIL